MLGATFASPAERRRADQLAEMLDDGRAPADHELASLVALATSIRPAPLHPSDDFRASLRERLVAEASARTPAAVPAPRSAPGSPRPVRRRVTRAVAAAATVSLIGGAGLAAASTQALPGEHLYGLKRSLESAELRLAGSDMSRGRELLEQAGTRLSEAESLARGETAREPATRARIDELLTEMDASVVEGADTLKDVYRVTGDPEALEVLDQFVIDQSERLADLMDLLDPSSFELAQAVTDRLDVLSTEVRALTGGMPSSSAAGSLPSPGSLVGEDRQVALPRDADGAADGTTSGNQGGGSADDTVGGSGAGGGSVADDVAGTVGDTADGVTGGLTGGGTGTGSGTGTGGLGLPLPKATSDPVPTPTPTPTKTKTKIPVPEVSLPEVPLPTPSVEACVELPPLNDC